MKILKIFFFFMIFFISKKLNKLYKSIFFTKLPSPNQNPTKTENSSQFENVPDPQNQTTQKTPEINITASGIPISNTLNSSGSISYLPGTT